VALDETGRKALRVKLLLHDGERLNALEVETK
jgi:hypothetical protein